MAVLPICLSDDAHVQKPWLRPGMALWTQGPLAFERDYFLPLPSVDSLDTCRKRARYSDSRHLSRSLLSSLKTEDGEDLLLTEAPGFWTEHSDRSGVDGWLATLVVDQSLRSFVGRWSKQSAADLYVRTSLPVTENLQKLAAAHAKDCFSGGADHFGEEPLLDQLRAYLRSQNVAGTAIEAQVRRVTVADLSKHPVPLSRVSSAGNLEDQAVGEDLVPIEDGEPATVGDLDIAVALACGDIELKEDTVDKCAAQVRDDKEVDEAPEGCVISRTRVAGFAGRISSGVAFASLASTTATSRTWASAPPRRTRSCIAARTAFLWRRRSSGRSRTRRTLLAQVASLHPVMRARNPTSRPLLRERLWLVEFWPVAFELQKLRPVPYPSSVA